MDGDSLLKDIFSRDPNRMYVTTMGKSDALVEPIKDVVQRD